MFWSKIWFFLVAVAAAASLTIALTLPRPAERATAVSETVRLKRACGVTNILLTQNARDRVDLASAFARADAPPGRPRLKVDSILYNASKADKISKDMHLTAKSALTELVDNVKGNKPDFVIAVDRQGRVVARTGVDEDQYGDSVKGYFAIDDALDGYLRDDIWRHNNTLYRIAASPVIERRAGAYAGVIVLGHEFNKALAERLTDSSGAYVAFYAAGGATASSTSATIHKDVVAGYQEFMKKLAAGDDGGAQEDCANGEPFVVGTDAESYSVMVARLPGEGREADAFYAVYAERPKGVGFMGTLNQVTSNDLKFGTFPWIPVGLAFLLAVGVGIALMVYEADRPTRRLVKDAVALAKGEVPRLEELKHKGKYGSIARSVNIVLDKLERETKAAKRDLDNILGPAPAAKVKKPMPPSGPGGLSPAPFSPPPPSEFKFNDGGGARVDSVRPPTEDQSSPAAAPFDLDLPPPPPAIAETPPPRPTVDSPPPQAPQRQAAPIPPPPISLPPDDKPKRPRTPPPLPPSELTPPPAPVPQAPEHLDDDILADDSGPSPAVPAGRTRSDFDDPTVVADPSHSLLEQSAKGDGNGADDEFRRVFDEFTALKKQCGESVASLTFEKFSNKLRKNRDALIAKHGCRSVKFQVYIKDGKAALKATPVKG